MTAFLQILVMVGAIGLFLYGMKTMSEAIQKFAGGSLRKGLRNLTSSPFKALATGTFVTGLIQSSSAMSIMVVSFVNAGMIHLNQAIAVILGANIGTTVTAWLVALFGFSLDLSLAAIPLIGIAFPLVLLRRNKIRSIGNALVGFALLMLAIGILKDTMISVTDNPGMIGKIADFSNYGPFAPLVFLLIGGVLTAVFQSSSATIALTIVLGAGGLIPFNCALAMVLGENLGTTATANIAATLTNAEAKRAAFSHFLINLFGVLWAMILLNPITEFINWILGETLGTIPLKIPADQPLGIAVFHTLFNLVNVAICFPFTNQIARISRQIISDRSGKHKQIRHLSTPFFSTAELYIVQAQNELAGIAKNATGMFQGVRCYFKDTNAEQAEKTYTDIRCNMQEIDRMHADFDQFLAQSAQDDISNQTHEIIQTLFRLAEDLDTLAGQNEQMAKVIRRKRERNIWFTPQVREQMLELFDELDKFYQLMNRALTNAHYPNPVEAEARARRQSIVQTLRLRQEEHLLPNPEKELKYQAGIIFSELLGCVDTISVSLYKITEDIACLHAYSGRTFNPRTR